jgi:acetyl esterase/lipase
LLAAHIDVAVVNYALSPQVSIEDIVRLMEACTWLYRSADTFAFDRELITVGGHSASHLAAMLCRPMASLGDRPSPT